LHLARVASRGPGGAFLSLHDGRDAFLPDDEADPARSEAAPIQPTRTLLVEGALLPVRLTRAPLGGKAARASARLDLSAIPEGLLAPAASPTGSRLPTGAPRLLRPAPSPPERWLAETPSASVLSDDADLVSRLRLRFPDAAPRIAFHPGPAPLLDPSLVEAVDALAEPTCDLGDKARLVFTPTPALVAVDLDGGSLPVAEANRRAAAELPRQLGLRGLGGAIVVDFAGSRRPSDRRTIERILNGSLAASLPDAHALGFTRGGLFELSRPRIRPALHEVLGVPPTPLTIGLRGLRRTLAGSRGTPSAIVELDAPAAAVAALVAEPQLLADLERRFGQPVSLCPRPAPREEDRHAP